MPAAAPAAAAAPEQPHTVPPLPESQQPSQDLQPTETQPSETQPPPASSPSNEQTGSVATPPAADRDDNREGAKHDKKEKKHGIDKGRAGGHNDDEDD